MLLSHVCPRCGLDLARERAVVEPFYGLPVVVCPGCAMATVRRRHPVAVRWRRARAVLWSAAVMVGQTVILFALAGLWIALSIELPDWARHVLSGGLVTIEEWAVSAIPCFVVIGTGAYFRCCLPHWRAAWLWSVWTGAVAALWAARVFVLFVERVDHRESLTFLEGRAELLLQASAHTGELAALVGMVLVATAGIPLGAWLHRLSARARAGAWRRHLARRRRRRLA